MNEETKIILVSILSICSIVMLIFGFYNFGFIKGIESVKCETSCDNDYCLEQGWFSECPEQKVCPEIKPAICNETKTEIIERTIEKPCKCACYSMGAWANNGTGWWGK